MTTIRKRTRRSMIDKHRNPGFETKPLILLGPPSAWEQWPASIPMPTEKQIKKANERYMKTVRPETMSDYDMGNLFFVMATWNRDVWWPFFFPKDKAWSSANAGKNRRNGGRTVSDHETGGEGEPAGAGDFA